MAYKLTLDISTDFTDVCGDFHESVTFRATGQADVVLTDCVLTEPHTWRELEPTGAQVIRRGTLFVWPKSKSDMPPLGSTIIDHQGFYWTVLSVEDVQHVETWESKAINLNIVTAAVNVATVLKAVYTHGEAGEAKAQWRGVWSGQIGGVARDTVKARFQQSVEQARLEFGAESSREVYRVYFESPVPIELAGGEYRLIDSAGHRYRVMRYETENRIDRLPVAIAEYIVEGAEYVA